MSRRINVKSILESLDQGLSLNQTARKIHASKKSVFDVAERARNLGISYKDVLARSDDDLYRLFFPEKPEQKAMYEKPDYEYVAKELGKVGVTLKLLHYEYRDDCRRRDRIPVGYSKYCKDYDAYRVSCNYSDHIIYKPGMYVEVDWSGPSMHYVDTDTGEIITVYLFCSALPYSQMAFVQVCPDMKEQSWLQCHVEMFEYFGGSTPRLICDNLKTGIIRHPKKGEIDFNGEYLALATHYHCAILPCGIRKPRQKSAAEHSVCDVATYIIAKTRNREFHNLLEIRNEVRHLLDIHNEQQFEKREGSRRSCFLAEEKARLQPLPPYRYESCTWFRNRKVQPNSHVVFERNFYSCDYRYIGKLVDLKVTGTSVELYRNDERIAIHDRFPKGISNRYSTRDKDMPKDRRFQEWSRIRIVQWSQSIGRNCETVVERIFAPLDIEEQGFNAALSVLRLSDDYGARRLECACAIALKHVSSPRYRNLNAILSSEQDLTQLQAARDKASATKGFTRGSEYFGTLGKKGSTMLNEETKKQLRRMNIGELVDIVARQDSIATYAEMPFEERFGYIIQQLFEKKIQKEIEQVRRRARLFFPHATMGDIHYLETRCIPKETILNLGSGTYLERNINVVFLGPTQCGKTYIACAIANDSAISECYRTKYVRMHDLLSDVSEKSPLEKKRICSRYGRYKLLIVDEWLTHAMNIMDVEFLLDILDRRKAEGNPTFFCSLYPISEWVDRMGRSVTAESVVSRAVSKSICIDCGTINMSEYLG